MSGIVLRAGGGGRVPADFDELYAAGFAPLAGPICGYLGDPGKARAVVGRAYRRAWRRWGKVGRAGDPAGWVRRTAWRLAVEREHRRGALPRFLQLTGVAADVDPEHAPLIAALRRLPERQRLAFVLHYLAQLPVDLVAAQVAVPRATVVGWLHRDRDRLAAELSHAGTAPAGVDAAITAYRRDVPGRFAPPPVDRVKSAGRRPARTA